MLAVQRRRTVQDTLWGCVELPGWLWAVIDTPVFQRTRRLKQVGLAHYVFPGATHTRFSHSLGTAHLADVMMTNLTLMQPDVAITAQEHAEVVLAALCHDLGHGPCSHVFDRVAETLAPTWSHEACGAQLLRHLVASNPAAAAAVDGAGVRLDIVCAMIVGDVAAAAPGRQFLFEVVCNAACGVDVDKCDYLSRDALYLHMPPGLDAKRLVLATRVVRLDDGSARLAWPVKEGGTVASVFVARQHLHQSVFQHRVVRVLERMAVRALIETCDRLEVSPGVTLRDAARDVDAVSFVSATDRIVEDAIDGGGTHVLFNCIRQRRLWSLADEELCAALPAHVTETTLQDAIVRLCGAVDIVVDIVVIGKGKRVADPPLFFEKLRAQGTVALHVVPAVPGCALPHDWRIVRVFAVDDAALAATAGVLKRMPDLLT